MTINLNVPVQRSYSSTREIASKYTESDDQRNSQNSTQKIRHTRNS